MADPKAFNRTRATLEAVDFYLTLVGRMGKQWFFADFETCPESAIPNSGGKPPKVTITKPHIVQQIKPDKNNLLSLEPSSPNNPKIVTLGFFQKKISDARISN